MLKLVMIGLIGIVGWEPAINCFNNLKTDTLSFVGQLSLICPSANLPDYWEDVVRSCDGEDINFEITKDNIIGMYVEVTTENPDLSQCATLECYFAPNDMLAVKITDVACMFNNVAPMHNFAMVGSTFEELKLTRCVIKNTSEHYFANFLVEEIDQPTIGNIKPKIKRKNIVGEFFGTVTFQETE